MIVYTLFPFFCLPHEVQTTRPAIQSNSREVGMVEEMFEDGLPINGTNDDADKLVFPRTFISFKVFTPLESCATFGEALRTLKFEFLKATRSPNTQC